MTTPAQIGYGKYGGYEGPYFRGAAPFVEPADPSDAEKILAATTATEGGRWDAINSYDRCIISVGLIQWCEANQFSVSDMLGKVMERDPALLAPLQTAMNQSGATLKQNGKGQWRFYTASGETVTLAQQQRLFLLNSNGKEGSWDDASKTHARTWAAGVASVFQQVEAQKAQAEFTVPRLKGFALQAAQGILWGAESDLPNDAWVGAIRAAYITFAVNLPAVANSMIQKAPTAGLTKWSPDWCIAIMKQLTFGPNIAIYPHRYEAIRPVIERLYGVNLPDFAADLKAWQVQHGIDPSSSTPTFMSVKEIQEELIAEGMDLGPSGADGKDGPKTQAAVKVFQGNHGLEVDGVVGRNTRAALAAEWSKRHG